MIKRKNITLTKNINYHLSSTLFNMLTLLILTPFIINNLGTEEYGIYIILGTMIGFLGIMELGLGKATIYYVAKYYKQNDGDGVNRVFSATFWMFFILGIVLLMSLLGASNTLLELFNMKSLGSEEGSKLINYSIISFFLVFMASSFITIPQALLRYDLFSYLQIGQNIFRLIVNILAIYLGTGLAGLLISNIIVATVYIVVSIIMAHKLLPGLKLQWPTIYGTKEVFSYGVFSFFTSVIGMMWRYGDIFLIGYFLGPLYVAFFSVPQQIMLKLLGLLNSVGQVLFPQYANIETRIEREKLFLDSTYILLNASIIIFVPLAVIFNDFLTLWISSDFAKETYFVAILIASGSIIRGAFISYQALFQGIGKPKYLFYVTMASSITVIIGDIILIPVYGLNGAAYALLLAPIWGVITLYVTMTKVLDIQDTNKEMFILFIPVFVAAIDMFALFKIRELFSIEGWIGFLLFGFISVLIVVLSMLFASFVNGKFTLVSHFRSNRVNKNSNR
jgi:O-antigen/teichoic acid export membrane protein